MESEVVVLYSPLELQNLQHSELASIVAEPIELAEGAAEGEEILELSALEERLPSEKPQGRFRGQRDCHLWRTTGTEPTKQRSAATRYELKATGSRTKGALAFTVHSEKASFWEIAEDSDALMLSAFFHEKRKRCKQISEGWNHWLFPLREYMKWYTTNFKKKTFVTALKKQQIKDSKGDGARLCKKLGPPLSRTELRKRVATWARQAGSAEAAKDEQRRKEEAERKAERKAEAKRTTSKAQAKRTTSKAQAKKGAKRKAEPEERRQEQQKRRRPADAPKRRRPADAPEAKTVTTVTAQGAPPHVVEEKMTEEQSKACWEIMNAGLLRAVHNEKQRECQWFVNGTQTLISERKDNHFSSESVLIF